MKFGDFKLGQTQKANNYLVLLQDDVETMSS